MSLNDLASWANILALTVTLAALAVSAWRYVVIRGSELKKERFATYHQLIRSVSAGTDAHGTMKIQSQLAFIYELRNFPEYKELTEKILGVLREEWADDPDVKRRGRLLGGIDETLASLQRSA